MALFSYVNNLTERLEDGSFRHGLWTLQLPLPGMTVKSDIIPIFESEIRGVIVTGIDSLEVKAGPKHGNQGTKVSTRAPSRPGGIGIAIAESKCGRCGIQFNCLPLGSIKFAMIFQSAGTWYPVGGNSTSHCGIPQ
jgi:hypothetical protein